MVLLIICLEFTKERNELDKQDGYLLELLKSNVGLFAYIPTWLGAAEDGMPPSTWP